MRAHNGLPAAALLLVAIAVGCQKSDSDQDTSRGEDGQNREVREGVEISPRPQDIPAGQARADVQADDTQAQAQTDQDEQPATAELKRARQELADLAEGAISLRAALLGAEFKSVQPSGTAPARDSGAGDEEPEP